MDNYFFFFFVIRPENGISYDVNACSLAKEQG